MQSKFSDYYSFKIDMELQDYMIRLGAALLAGVLIGFEREWRLRSAGLLTNTLVAVGACIYIMASDIISADAVNADPSRVLGQIVAGIGFLGAGVIMRDGVNIHGLNSAATIWCSAAVGTLAGFHLLQEAFIAAGVIITANLCIRPIAGAISKMSASKKFVKNGRLLKVFIEDKNEAGIRAKIMEILQSYPNLKLKSFYVTQSNAFTHALEINCEFLYTAQDDFEQFFYEVSKIPDILKMQQDCIIVNN